MGAVSPIMSNLQLTTFPYCCILLSGFVTNLFFLKK